MFTYSHEIWVGECDLSILDNFFEQLPDNITGTFVIKSTVPIGTTKKYYERHNVIHNPEFLTARNAIQDFANSERNIVGGEPELCNDFVNFFNKHFPNIQVSLPPRMKAKQLNIFLIHSSLTK